MLSINKNKLKISILSLSLLTVMAGAAVAPALGVIQEHFSNSSQLLIQMIVSIPSIFIIFTSFIFQKLSKKFTIRTLVIVGLAFYTIAGSIAGLIDNIYFVLIMRALVGIGVGIIMPLSTGLISFFFGESEQEGLLGLSSAMNQMGGVIATLLAGVLSTISWSASFYVYLLGLVSFVLCLIYLPSVKLQEDQTDNKSKTINVFKDSYQYIIAIFLSMTCFYIYPLSFSIERISAGIIPNQYIAPIMAGLDLIAFLGGLSFVLIKRKFRNNTRILAPLFFLLGYTLLTLFNGWTSTIIGSILIGFANGLSTPYLISEVSRKFGKSASVTIMPLMSASIFLAQFVCPFLLSTGGILGGYIIHLPYVIAILFSVIFFLWSLLSISNNKIK